MSDAPNNFKSVKLNTENLKFSGRKEDFKSWLAAIELFMIGNPNQFPDDQVKIVFALSWMTGSRDVKTWATNRQSEFIAKREWGTWDEFEDLLEDHFGDPAAESQAWEYLWTYKQGRQGSRSFFNQLELWFTLANFTDEED